MVTDFEKEIKAAFIEAKIGDRIDEIAEVDLHFVLPLAVFVRYEKFINEVTDGEFHVNAVYNLVLLYTDGQDAQRAGTVMFGRELDGLITAWSNALDEIAAEPDKSLRLKMFTGTHAYFRSALWRKPNPSDPCASANPLLKKSTSAKKSFWGRFLN